MFTVKWSPMMQCCKVVGTAPLSLFNLKKKKNWRWGLNHDKLGKERNILPTSDFASAPRVSITPFDLITDLRSESFQR